MDLVNNKIYVFHNGELRRLEIRFKFIAVTPSRARLFHIHHLFQLASDACSPIFTLPRRSLEN